MEAERRRSRRINTDLLVNKFIDGLPHANRLLELNPFGCLLEELLEPSVKRELYPLELALPASLGGTRLWLWGRPVWRRDGRTALRFVGVDPLDRAALRRFADALT